MNYSFAMGTYNFTIPAQNAGEYVRFYIETVSNNNFETRTYSPKGAEHEVYIYQVQMQEIVLGDLVINEIMASNDQTQADQYGEYDDWIELYNNGTQSINLSGYHLSDDLTNLSKYTFGNSIIGPN